MEKLTAKRCYELLGLKPGATLAQIREKRGQLAHQWHPDKETDPQRKASLEDKMKDINNAFDFLKGALSGTSAPSSAAEHGTAPTRPPAAKKPWEAEAEERRKRTLEREAEERREKAARQRVWKANFQREQAEAARQRALRETEAARLQTWLAQEKERQDQEGKVRDQRNVSLSFRQGADAHPPVPLEEVIVTRPRQPKPPARQEMGPSKHIYLKGKCTKCGQTRENITSYQLVCL